MEEWISKKDLLMETGISYGQLYRWKREGLIPDSWFVKKSSFTGQETHLPRARIVERIQFIVAQKDQYTLKQLQALLSPSGENRVYKTTTLMRIPGAFRALERVAALTGARHFSHGQALCVLIAADMLAHCEMDERSLTYVIKTLLAWQEERNIFSLSDGRLILMQTAHGALPVFFCADGDFWMPSDVSVAFELRLSDVPGRYTRQLSELSEED